MENKLYYTPTIEEFHVGFECELRNSSGPIFEWEPFKIIGVDDGEISGNLMDWSFYDTRTAIKDEQIRVKYLDKSDIESLGWTFKSTNKMRTWYTGSDSWFNNTIPTGDSGRYWDFELSHDPKYNGIIIKAGTNYGETDTFFEGTIKNKSELIKLMQQLNIK